MQPRRNRKVPKFANLSEAISLSKIELIGIAAEPALPGQTAKICTRLMMTSDDPFFHTIAESLSGAIEHQAANDGEAINLKKAATALLVVKPNGTADLWIDTAAMTLNILTKRSVKTGSAIFEDHIADVVGMDFALAAISGADRVICIFRVGWRFALFFDLDRAKSLDLTAMLRDLGTLFRVLRYRNLYDAVANPAIFDRLITAGWFPFPEIY